MTKIIGLLGEAKTGKDTAGTILKSFGKNVYTLAYADKIKAELADLYDLTPYQLYGAGKDEPTAFDCNLCPVCGSTNVEPHGKDAFRCKLCTVIGATSVFTSKWTPRMMMQHHGEKAREIDPHVWIKWAHNRINSIDATGVDPLNQTKVKKPDLYVITDVRRMYESESIWALDGEVWKIQRQERPAISGLPRHITENEVKEIPDNKVQAVINNDRTEEALRAELRVQFDRVMKK